MESRQYFKKNNADGSTGRELEVYRTGHQRGEGRWREDAV